MWGVMLHFDFGFIVVFLEIWSHAAQAGLKLTLSDSDLGLLTFPPPPPQSWGS